MRDAKYWIRQLGLEPHPEGGFYRQTYRAEMEIEVAELGTRAASTAIYYLLEGKAFSAFHRLRSDEVWHFYAGGALVVEIISPDGERSSILLGPDAEAGEAFRAVVKAGCWFGSRLKNGNAFALVGCTVAPGFEFADFEMGKREELVKAYPQHRIVIESLTRH